MRAIATNSHQPWNKGKLVGQKVPLRLRDIWAIRIRLQLADRVRDQALFDLAIDSKLRACDLTKLLVRDAAHGEHVSPRAIVMQQKTQRPVQFEITEQTRTALEAWMHQAHLRSEDFLFPSRTSIHATIRTHCQSLGDLHWLGPSAVRHSHAAAHQGIADLPPDEEPESSPASAGPYEAGKHSQISWD